jgi:hypothetical protein
MSDKPAVYTEAEARILATLAELETRIEIYQKTFESHAKDDREDFSKLYKANEHVLEEIGKMPERLIECGARFKVEIMKESEKKFVNVTDFKVLKTWLLAVVAIGSSTGATIGAVLSYAASMKGIIGG